MEEEKKRVIREVKSERFKEIKKDKKEENLEEEVNEETSDFREFSKFVSRDRAAPVLESAENAEPIESVLENVPTPSKKEEKAVAYNVPEYAASVYENRRAAERERAEIFEPTSLPMIRMRGEVERERTFGIQQENMATEGRQRIAGNEDEYVITARRLEEERNLPFEDKKRRRLF